MAEHFTGGAAALVADARQHARRLGHGYAGCEHLLLAAASAGDGTGSVLREHGVTPQAVETEIVRLVASCQAPAFPGPLDGEALASIGIDLDQVRSRADAAFGPHALARAARASAREPAWRRGLVAEIARRRRRRAARRAAQAAERIRAAGQLPLTASAGRCLHRSGREARALGSSHTTAEHLTLSVITADGGMLPAIMRRLRVTAPALRAAILGRSQKAS